MFESQILNRIEDHAREWHVRIEDKFETETSVIAFGSRDQQQVVLKVLKQPGDEWHSGEILRAFAGDGVVRAYEHAPGAVLLKRLRPGNSLVEISLNSRDDEATDILANVIRLMAARTSSLALEELPRACATVHDWAKGFERYIARGDNQIPAELFNAGQRVYAELCVTQRNPLLLHGDLQHHNVLFDADCGWLAIDPKGIVGELEYEIGAIMRNPVERPDMFLSRATIETRLSQFSNILNLDYERMLAWTFSQAVLSAIWDIEDGFEVKATNSALRLAEITRPMLGIR